MPAVSESQQRLFGMVHAYQKGKLKNPPKKVKEVAKHISEEDAEHFARTKHKGLPEKKAYMHGFMDKLAESGLLEKEAAKALGLTEKRAQSSPLNRLKFSTIRRWVKAMRGMRHKDIKAFAKSEDVINSLPVYRGGLGDPGFRKTVFPRRSLFRGSLGFLSGGGQTGDGLLAEELDHLPKMLWQNATPVPNYAIGYGNVLSVYNARKLPGVLSGRRNIAGDRMMFGYLKDGDPTKPVNSTLFKSWYERPKRMRMLDSHSADFNAINASEHGQIETLVNSIKERPQRVYKRNLVGYDPASDSYIADFYDVTPLERFYRAIPDSPTAAIDRENLQYLVRYIGRGGAS